MTGNNDKRCFVICPIGEEGSPERDHADQVLKCLVTPIVNGKLGYTVIRADHIAEPGLITRQIIDHLMEDELVVADLTGHNPNVFYELAIRHAVRKPVVQLIRAGDKIPFDVAQSRTIEFDVKRWDSLDTTRHQLCEHIKYALDRPENVDNLISVSVEFAALRAGATGEIQERLITMIDELSSAVRSLEFKVESQRRAQYQGEHAFIPGATLRALGRIGKEEGKEIDPLGSVEDIIDVVLDKRTSGATGHNSPVQ